MPKTTLSTSNCPTRSQLRRFALGAAAPDEVERIALHLARSPDCHCSAVVASFDSEQDELLAAIKEPIGADVYDSEDACREAVAKAASLTGCSDTAPASDQPAGPREPPEKLGPYRNLESLGRGGMGEVFRAFDERLHRSVAVKVVRQDRFADESSVARFHAEAETAARLDHPNIVPIYEVNTDRGQHFIAMKLVDGRPLSEMADRCKDDPYCAAELVATIAHAIHYAHQRQVIHRDLKPSNILVDGSGVAFISDFGLAKRLDADSNLTQTGAILGTPSYMAPEQAVGNDDEITTATDVYGLGGILYFVLTGRAPFEGKQPVDILRKVVDSEPRPPSRDSPRIDRDLDTICLKCLSKDPARRYGSAEALANDLERWLRTEPILARRIAWPQRIARWCKRRPLAASLATLAALLAILVAVGSPLAAISMRRQSLETKKNLFASQLALARAERQSDRPDHRRVGLEAVRGALAAADGFNLASDERLALRNEAIAALAFPDVHLEIRRQIPSSYPGFDGALAHYAYIAPTGQIVVRRMADGTERTRVAGIGPTDMPLLVSPSCRYIATINADPNKPGMSVYSVKKGEHLWSKELDIHMRAIDFSPDDKRLAVRSEDDMLRVFESESGKLITQAAFENARNNGFQWHPDGKHITIADGTKVVRSFHVESEQIDAEFKLPEEIRDVCWRSDGKMFAAVAWENIHLWNAENNSLARTFRRHAPSVVLSASFGPDGQLVASNTHSGVTKVWSTATGQVLAEVTGLFPKFSAKNRRLAVVGWEGGSHAIRVWCVEPPEVLTTHQVGGTRPQFLEAIAISNDGNQVVATSSDGLWVWELPSMKLLRHVSLADAYGVAALPEPGRWLVNCRRGLVTVRSECRPVSPKPARPESSNAPNPSPSSSGRRSAVVEEELGSISSPPPPSSGRRSAAAEEGLGVGALAPDVAVIGQPLSDVIGVRYFQLAASRDASRVAAVVGPGEILLLDRKTAERRTLHTGHNELPLAVSPDGNLVVSAIDRKLSCEVVAWDFATGERIAKVGDCGRGYLKILFSPDGRRLVVGSGVYFRCWERDDAGTWQLLYTVPRGEAGIWGACAFSPDGRTLAAVDTQRLIKLRDAATGEEFCTLRSPAPQPNIANLAFSPDGKTLFVAGENHLLQSWNLARLHEKLSRLALDW